MKLTDKEIKVLNILDDELSFEEIVKKTKISEEELEGILSGLIKKELVKLKGKIINVEKILLLF